MIKEGDLLQIEKNSEFIVEDYFREELYSFIRNIASLPIKIEGILLFGSLARGIAEYSEHHLSDIDLIIISEELPEDLWQRNELLYELTKNYRTIVQTLWWTPEEIKNRVKNKDFLILDALDEGKILFDPKGLLENLREELRDDLKKKGVIKTDLYWRWPLKKFGDRIEF